MKISVKDFENLGIYKPEIYTQWLNDCFKKFNVNTPNRIIALLMNLMHESGNFKLVKEIASGKAYEGNKILGNIQKGDGPKFVGRGLGQITGRWNYSEFTRWCKKNIINFNLNFEQNPELLEQPKWAVLSAFWYWEFKKCAVYADLADFKNVASIWNTGRINSKIINGWDQRVIKQKKLEKWIVTLITE